MSSGAGLSCSLTSICSPSSSGPCEKPNVWIGVPSDEPRISSRTVTTLAASTVLVRMRAMRGGLT